ncbi:MAG TPA: hypothetical protein ACFCUY_07935 [Xenococcaceae cyanobacterium]|jgi:carbon dioxide concentrating mechanism protein CcmN
MYLPPLQPVVNSKILISGDVEIHPTASVAPGVILQAAPQSRIVIGADVCLGMGVILNAYGGVINVKNGVTLGSGVLIIGNSTIGSNACIGTATTIFNASVESMKVITPGSIIGDTSRYVTTNENEVGVASTNNQSSSKLSEANDLKQTLKQDAQTTNGFEPEKQLQHQNSSTTESQSEAMANNSLSDNSADPWSEEKIADSAIETVSAVELEAVENKIETVKGTAIGKVYIDQLLVTLFPHKNSLNNASNTE